MENETQILDQPFRLRANRKVVEGQCGICGKGFVLAEDVYACPFCSGYHHATCWEERRACSGPGGAVALETAAGDDPSPSQPAALPELASDERRCSGCTQVIKRDAMKCRFCGRVFDQEFAAQITVENMPPALAQEAESSANRSLVMGLISVVLCLFLVSFWLFILAGAAISKGLNARRLINQHPNYASGSLASTKATAGIVTGGLAILLSVFVLLSLFNK